MSEKYLRFIYKDIRHYFPARIIPSFINFIAISIYTRILTPEEYGNYILVITAVTFTTSLGFTWLNQANIRFFEKFQLNSNLNEFYSTNNIILIFLIGIITSVWVIITIIIYYFNKTHFTYLLILGSLLLLSEGLFSYILSILRVQRRGKLYKNLSILKYAGTLIIAIVFIEIFYFDSDGIIIASSIMGFFVILYFINKNNSILRINTNLFSKDLFKKNILFGLPLAISSFSGLILAISDRYLISFFLNNENVGVYSAGYRISEMSISLFSGILMLTAYPLIIKSFEHDGKNEAKNLIKNLTSIYIVSLVPVIVLITFLSKDLTIIFLGKEFFMTYEILPWISLGAFFAGLTQFVNKSFELKEKTFIMLLLISIASLINVILNIFFIPAFGILGASYTTVISYFFYLIFSWIISRKIFYWDIPWESIIKCLVSTTLMFFATAFITKDISNIIISIISKTILVVTFYSSLMILFKERLFLNLLSKFKIHINYFSS